MKYSLHSLFSFITSAAALSLPLLPDHESSLKPRQSCENTATSRSCWGNYSIDTNYYEEVPDTGVTREYWLSVEQGSCAPDGVERTCMTFNGTAPGPTITVSPPPEPPETPTHENRH